MPKYKVIVLYTVIVLMQACSSGNSTPGASSAQNTNTAPDGNTTPSNDLPVSTSSAYNPSEVPVKRPLEQNLIADGTFETDVDSNWQFCGSASVRSSPQASEGSNTLLLSSNGEKCVEGDGIFSDGTNAVASTMINLDYSPEQLYITFDIKASARISDLILEIPFRIRLHDESDNLNLENYFSGAEFLNIHDDIVSEHWTRIRYKLDNDEFSGLVENSIPKQLTIYFSFSDPVDVELDNLRLTVAREVTQADPMPESLLNNPGNQPLAFTNITDSGVATMLANGSNLVTHNDVSNSALVSAPAWYSDNQITYGLTTFSDPIANGSVIAAAQSELFLHNLSTGQSSIIFDTTGSPGLYNFSNDPNNTDALDVQVKRVSWDNTQNIGAISICANVRSFAFVGDDICRINIVDSNANFLHGSLEIGGYDSAFSSTGKLAYVQPGSFDMPPRINIMDDPVNAPDNIRTIYESDLNFGDTVEWSPDAQSIIFLERAGDLLPSGVYVESIKEINVNTGVVRELLIADHGDTYASLSWGDNGYIVYSLFIASEDDPSVGLNQIWWLDPRTGKTGPITTSIGAYGGKFR